MIRKTPLSALLLSGASLAIFTGVASAQETSAEEIVVTATGRQASVQEVPIAVTALSNEALEQTGASDLREITQLAPSMTFTTGQSASSGSNASIRGVGTGSDNPGFEGAVGIFIDGVFRARAGQAISDLPEVQRIEVLRGPQGTLFGRNTSAGAISVVTARPSYETGAWLEGSYGFDDLNEAAVRAGGNVAIIDNVLAMRFDGSVRGREGFMHDIVSGRETQDQDRTTARLQALWDISPDASLRVILDRATADEICCSATPLQYNNTTGTQAIVNGINTLLYGQSFQVPINRDARFTGVTPGRDFRDVTEESGISGQLDWDLGFANLTSITAYRDYSSRRNQDIDANRIDIAYRDGLELNFENFTQEFRLQGEAGRLNWLVGLFYSDETIDTTDRIRTGSDYSLFVNEATRGNTATAPGGPYELFDFTAANSLFATLVTAFPNIDLAAAANAYLTPVGAGAGQQRDNWIQESQGLSIFTHNEISLTDRTILTLGARYNDEQRDVRASLLSNQAACASLRTIETTLDLDTTTVGVQGGAVSAMLAGPAGGLIILACNPAVNDVANGNYTGSRSEGEWSGTISLRHNFTDNLMVYGGVSRGYKSGGFNLDRSGLPIRPSTLSNAGLSLSQIDYEPEFTDSYEIGVRSTILGGTTFLNATLFHQRLSDFQQNSFNGTNFFVANIPEVISQGVELEVSSRPTDRLNLNFGVTYLDAYYNSTVNFIAPLTDTTGANTVRAGQQITGQADWRVTGGIAYDAPLSENLQATFYLDGRWTSEYRTQTLGRAASGVTDQAAVAVFNGRISLTNPNSGRWAVDLWGRNLTDETIIGGFEATLQPGTFVAFTSEPQTYGVTLRARY